MPLSWTGTAGIGVFLMGLGVLRWFEELAVTHTEQGETILTGSLADKPTLYSLLARLRDLGLPLVSVNPAQA